MAVGTNSNPHISPTISTTMNALRAGLIVAILTYAVDVMGKIMVKPIFLLLAFFAVSGCSLMIERSAKYSEFSLENGHTRGEIISEVGEPIKTNIHIRHQVINLLCLKSRLFGQL